MRSTQLRVDITGKKCVCACMCSYVSERSSEGVAPRFWARSSHWPAACQIVHVGWPTHLRDPAASASSALQIQAHGTCLALYVGAADCTQVWQGLYQLSYCPSPGHYLKKDKVEVERRLLCLSPWLQRLKSEAYIGRTFLLRAASHLGLSGWAFHMAEPLPGGMPKDWSDPSFAEDWLQWEVEPKQAQALVEITGSWRRGILRNVLSMISAVRDRKTNLKYLFIVISIIYTTS